MEDPTRNIEFAFFMLSKPKGPKTWKNMHGSGSRISPYALGKYSHYGH